MLEIDPGPDPDDAFAKALIEVVERLVALQPEKLELVQVAKGRTYPSVTIRNIRYQAVPLDHELVPFLDLLVLLSRGSTPPVIPEVTVEILIAPTCPNCGRKIIGDKPMCLYCGKYSVRDLFQR